MPEDIQSPPYPKIGVQADGLFNHLRALREWILHYREDLNARVGRDIIPDVRNLPDRRAYALVGIEIQNQHLLFMCRLREGWDYLVRNYEDAWDCEACVQARATMTQTAAVVLNGAFVPYEQREHSKQSDAAMLQRMFDDTTRMFQELRRPIVPARE